MILFCKFKKYSLLLCIELIMVLNYWSAYLEKGLDVLMLFLKKAISTITEKLLIILYLGDNIMDYIYFFGLESPFSNFHPAIFKYKDITFVSNEQFMMYSKARNFNDLETAKKILDINNKPLVKKFINQEISKAEIISIPENTKEWKSIMAEIKKYGRQVKNFNASYWDSKKYNIVKFGAILKFSQNLDLQQDLLDTHKSLMCEASHKDNIWGCGLTEKEARLIDPINWPGQNLLGKVLDDVKQELLTNTNSNNSKLKL